MDDITARYKMGYPETPVNLPDNQQQAEYGSDAIADLISSLGFEHVFLVPGSSFRGLHDSLVNHLRNRTPEMILCPTESIAVSMAHGYSKATGKPSLCIIHDLVGLMLGTMSVYNAACDHAPVVILGGSGPLNPDDRRYIDWAHTASTQCDLVKPMVKWTAEPPTLQSTLDQLAKAHKIAASAPTGPVYVSIDQGAQECAMPANLIIPDVDLPRYQPAPPTAANPDALAQAADMLLSAKMPLIIGGRFGRNSETTAPLVKLLELTGAAYVDDRSIVCIPTGHSQNLSGDDSIRDEADVVLTVDCIDPTNALLAYSGHERGRDGQAIIEMSMNNIAHNSWTNFASMQAATALQIDCDPLFGIAQLADVISQRLAAEPGLSDSAATRISAISARHDALRARQNEDWKVNADQAPITGARMVFELYQAVKDKPWILPVRNHRSFPEGVWQFNGSGEYYGSDGGGGVGYGPGASIGAALALKKDKKICASIMGDGDYLMSSSAVWTAVHYQIPLLMVINNNNSWGNDEHHQIKVARARNRPIENAWIGQRMIDPDIDYAATARGFGAWAEGPISDPNALAEVFRQAITQVEDGKVAVVDVRTSLATEI